MTIDRSFEETFTDLVTSLGDTTRREIYLEVRGSKEARSVADIAEVFGIHVNVARYHLDHLVDAGYLQTTTSSSGPSGGRPANLYQSTDLEIHLDLPGQSFELLSRLLAEVLQRVPAGDIERLAYEVGHSHGEELAASLDLATGTDLSAAVEAAAGVMRSVGFENVPTTAGPGCGYQTTHCPFGKVAVENPRVVCALDRGLVTGLLNSFHGPVDVSVVPHSRLPEPCTTVVVAQG